MKTFHKVSVMVLSVMVYIYSVLLGHLQHLQQQRQLRHLLEQRQPLVSFRIPLLIQ